MNRLAYIAGIVVVTISVLVNGVRGDELLRPAKLLRTGQGNLLVAEVGTSTALPNSGRISIVDRLGNRRTLIDGLPSAPTNPANTPSGPSGLYLSGRTLYVAIGEGDVTLRGPEPRTEVPNPAPSSPIFSSVLAVHFSAAAERNTTGVVLNLDDHFALAAGHKVVRHDAQGRKITVELIADFPDYVAEPTPSVPANVRHSHPYGVVADDTHLYVVDGGFNSVHRVDIDSGASSTLISLPKTPNPTTFGPPMIENVPTSIRWDGDQLLITVLSGFPFVPGLSVVRSVDPDTGGTAVVIAGLSSAIDVIPLSFGGVQIGYLTLEYSQNHLAGGPGRLQLFDVGGNPVVVLADDLNAPSAMEWDGRTFELAVSSISLGTLKYFPLF